jgi:4-carboxymuconolactone decarboxylase
MEGQDSRDESGRVRLPPLIRHGGRALAATVAGKVGTARAEYAAALAAGVPPPALAEVARMAHLFGGFPRAILGLEALHDAFTRAGAAAPADPEASPRSRTEDRARGESLFRRIYAGQSDEVLRRIERAAPGFASWVLEDAYGRVLSRPLLTEVERELLAVVALVALDCPEQQKSHARGALRLGAAPDEVRAAVEVVAADVTEPALARARAVVAALSAPG